MTDHPTATGRLLLAADWLDAGGDVIHHTTLTDAQLADLGDGETVYGVTLTCGRRARWVHIPGVLTRMGAKRCDRCCDRVGIPRGVGSPKNDEACGVNDHPSPAPPSPPAESGHDMSETWTEPITAHPFRICICNKCGPPWRNEQPQPDVGRDWLAHAVWNSFMRLCSRCGNKRCPGAADHDNPCTGSNEPGQPGSLYPQPAAIPGDFLSRLAHEPPGPPMVIPPGMGNIPAAPETSQEALK